jgi:hypothetical protein
VSKNEIYVYAELHKPSFFMATVTCCTRTGDRVMLPPSFFLIVTGFSLWIIYIIPICVQPFVVI